MGLNDKIASASSLEEIQGLLMEGRKYTFASPKTQRRWKYIAARRLKFIQAETEKSSVAEKPVKKKKS